jgi:hypothetical protein
MEWQQLTNDSDNGMLEGFGEPAGAGVSLHPTKPLALARPAL